MSTVTIELLIKLVEGLWIALVFYLSIAAVSTGCLFAYFAYKFIKLRCHRGSSDAV